MTSAGSGAIARRYARNWVSLSHIWSQQIAWGHERCERPTGLGSYETDEFAFRFNRRRSNARSMLFYRLAQQAVAISPVPYRDIINAAGD